VIRTLVVDDDFRVASIHAAYVEKVPGFVVVGQVHSAASLLASLTSTAPDLVLLDIYLPDLNGLEVLTRLRQPRSGARDVDVIVITAASDAASVKAAMQCGAVHYLLKPFGFTALEEKLVSYQEMRRQLQSMQHADQSSVDRVFAAMSARSIGSTSSPSSSYTLDAIEALLERSGGELSASEVAASLGVSRATAQRYLSRLEATGRITMALRYGSAGRPEHRYRHPRSRASGTG